MSDLIAALSTAPGRAGVGILRLSGPGAIAAAAAVFTPAGGGPLQAQEDRRLVLGQLRDRAGRVIDRAMAAVFHAPRSYTGEEAAELHCHGAPVVLSLALEALFAAGARQARAGEFTRRAFLNGRLDLSQAEAVADLIDAETADAVVNAAGQLSGALSRRLEAAYAGLVDVMAHFHAVLDYPDEDIDPFRAETVRRALDAARRELEGLLQTYDRGRHLTAGVPCAIVGRPNAGKSSLLNALLGYERAIVTGIPGTTRDTVEERCALGGVLLRLIDTAGIREGGGQIEQMGIKRSRAALEQAELCLLVVDGAQELTAGDRALMDEVGRCGRVICVVSKSDLPMAFDPALLSGRFSSVCVLSAVTGEGLARLEREMAALFREEGGRADGALLTNARQFSAATRAKERIAAAAAALSAGVSPDAVLMDVEEALAAVGELTGRSVREDIVNRIFERFCVGK